MNLFQRIFLVAACACLPSSAAALEQAALRIGKSVIHAEVADSAEARAVGLSGRSSLKQNHGMLFVFERPTRPQFWMRDTPLALDIAFIDSDGKIADIQNMAPNSDRLYRPVKLIRYALEMPHGWFRKHAITKNARVSGLAQAVGAAPRLMPPEAP